MQTNLNPCPVSSTCGGNHLIFRRLYRLPGAPSILIRDSFLEQEVEAARQGRHSTEWLRSSFPLLYGDRIEKSVHLRDTEYNGLTLASRYHTSWLEGSLAFTFQFIHNGVKSPGSYAVLLGGLSRPTSCSIWILCALSGF